MHGVIHVSITVRRHENCFLLLLATRMMNSNLEITSVVSLYPESILTVSPQLGRPVDVCRFTIFNLILFPIWENCELILEIGRFSLYRTFVLGFQNA